MLTRQTILDLLLLAREDTEQCLLDYQAAYDWDGLRREKGSGEYGARTRKRLAAARRAVVEAMQIGRFLDESLNDG